jgi:hypothetical protein
MDVDEPAGTSAAPHERTPSKVAHHRRAAAAARVYVDEFVDDSDDESDKPSKQTTLWRSKQERACWVGDVQEACTLASVAYHVRGCAFALALAVSDCNQQSKP